MNGIIGDVEGFYKTLIHHDFWMEPDRASIETFFENGGDPKEIDEYGENAAHYAVANGRADLLVTLDRAGVDTDAEDLHGATPLHAAARKRDVVAVAVLLALGADPKARTHAGDTPAYCLYRSIAAPDERARIEEILHLIAGAE